MRNGIANLLSLPQLEADEFTVSYHTGGNWIVTTPHGDEITFHQEEDGVCRGFPYIDVQSKVAVAMIQSPPALQRLHQAQSPGCHRGPQGPSHDWPPN